MVARGQVRIDLYQKQPGAGTFFSSVLHRARDRYRLVDQVDIDQYLEAIWIVVYLPESDDHSPLIKSVSK